MSNLERGMYSLRNQVHSFIPEFYIGVYIEGVVGIRLEDVVLVTDNEPEILSGERAKDWFNP